VYRLHEILQVDDIDKLIGLNSLSVSCISDHLLPYCLDSQHAERKSLISNIHPGFAKISD